MAITPDDNIGVDVELMRPGSLTRELALGIFAPAECRIIEACKEEEMDETLITLKEAYMTSTGKGLSIPLKSFAFALDPPSLAVPANSWTMRRAGFSDVTAQRPSMRWRWAFGLLVRRKVRSPSRR